MRGTTWDSRELEGLSLHDNIWFNAIREKIRMNDRKGLAAYDKVLDHLIRDGLISKDANHTRGSFQQTFRYAAVLAGRMTEHIHRVEGKVSVTPQLFFVRVKGSHLAIDVRGTGEGLGKS